MHKNLVIKLKRYSMLLIIDNQSIFIKKFKRQFLAEQDFDYIFFDHNQPLVLPQKAKIQGIILSGGKGNPYEPLNLTANFVALMTYKVPILGLCLGHEIIGVAYGGRIRKLAKYRSRKEKIILTHPEDPIFDGLDRTEILLTEKHSYELSELPPDFNNLAYSDACQFEIIKHKKLPVYGFQSHPEASGDDGRHIMINFLKMCGLINK